MGIETVSPKPGTSRSHSEHKVYPHLLKGLTIIRPNQVWATDITCIPMKCGYRYLAAVMNWYSRNILSWRLSNPMDSAFCIDALTEAISRACRDF